MKAEKGKEKELLKEDMFAAKNLTGD